MQLFDKIPGKFFAPLASKSRVIYAVSLVTLYDLLTINKSDIRKDDLVQILKNKGEDFFNLFNIESDEEEFDNDTDTLEENDVNESMISRKVNYIIRRLSKCGWFQIIRDEKARCEKIYLPMYSIKMLKLLYKFASDETFYLPLVHQTYSELKLEDEKEDDQMYRTLCNAKHNAEELEMSVTSLRHSIKVYKNELNSVTKPNEALHQHFDIFNVEVRDKIYHPMKTYDSLGLYTQPIIKILQKWQRDSRYITKIVNQASYDAVNQGKSVSDLTKEVSTMIQNVIDTFSKLNKDFFTIDNDNASYTEAVQKKVNFLSSSDRTIKGKIDAIIVAIADAIRRSPNDNIDNLDMIDDIIDSVNLNSVSFFDSDSLFMPRERKVIEDSDFMPIDDGPTFEERTEAFNEFSNINVDFFSEKAIFEFFKKNFGTKIEITTDEFEIRDLNDLVLYILGVVKFAFGTYDYEIEKLCDEFEFSGFIMPKYRFKLKEKNRK